MAENRFEMTSGWQITRSITGELDLVIHFLLKQKLFGNTILEFQDLLESIPPEWEQEIRDLLSDSSQLHSPLEVPAYLTGMAYEEDYSKATLPIRELNLTRAIELMLPIAQGLGLPTCDTLDPEKRFVELAFTIFMEPYHRLHFPLQDEFLRAARTEISGMVSLLNGQPSHDRYWHWMDRFYYEAYRPWRESRKPLMETLEQRALLALGSQQSADRVPDLSWLPDQNALQQYTPLHDAVTAGKLKVNFITDPFGISDSWSLLPFEVTVSYSSPGRVFTEFFDYANNLANRAQALADPTRLIILRLIRYFGMTNTDMAKFLNIARPTVSVHAKILREAGLIKTEADGRTAHHSINPGELRKLFDELEQFLVLPEDK
jgi:DNA-binding transcriptional ArsR family regulator